MKSILSFWFGVSLVFFIGMMITLMTLVPSLGVTGAGVNWNGLINLGCIIISITTIMLAWAHGREHGE